MNPNLVKCKKCSEWLIDEESFSHICYGKLEKMFFDSDGTFSFDGEKWYKWKTDEMLQRQKTKGTDGDDTEPYDRFCQVID